MRPSLSEWESKQQCEGDLTGQDTWGCQDDTTPGPKIFLILNQTYNDVKFVLIFLLASCDFLLKQEGFKRFVYCL